MRSSWNQTWWLAGLIWSLLSVSHSSAQDLSSKLSNYMDRMVTQQKFNGSVMVTKAGQTLLSKGYGWANVEHEVPNTPQTKFRIGSITKQFTAMAILILQQQDKLHVDDRIATYVHNSPEAWSEITIHHLLTHTSGIMHNWALPGWRDTMMKPAAVAETIDRFKNQPLLFKPGEGFQYSGVGYFILAQIIEQVSGQSYEGFLREMIFEPLGMHNTGADHYILILPQRASGYVRREGQLEHAPHIYMPILTGGGNLYSTVEDLILWDQALINGKLISKASYRRMYTPIKDNYAYGWRIQQDADRTVIRHGGGVPGFSSHILRVPEECLCVVFLRNVVEERSDERLSTPRIAKDLAAIVLGDPNHPGLSRMPVEIPVSNCRRTREELSKVEDLANIYVMVGEFDVAIDQLEFLLLIPSKPSIPLLRLDPAWEPLRGHRRFKKLLEQEK